MARGALTPLGPGRWRDEISERWWIERGPYGGYLCAILVRAGRSLTSVSLRMEQDGPGLDHPTVAMIRG